MGIYGHFPILPFVLTQQSRCLAQDPMTSLSTPQKPKCDNQIRGSLPQIFPHCLPNQKQA